MQSIAILKPENVKDVESILVYFVTLLLAVIVIVIPFAITQINKRFREKDSIISTTRASATNLQLKLDSEIEYNKNLGVSTTGVLKDNTAVLRTAIKSLEDVGVNVTDAKAIVKDNNSIVKDIKTHQQNAKNG